jgi:hypothetical protein
MAGGRQKGTKKTGGRKPGTPNKVTGMLKDAILEAATKAGEDLASNKEQRKDGMMHYLRVQATINPQAFMGLLGRVMPMQLQGDGEDGEIIVNVKLQK